MSPFYGLFERLLASILVLGALVGVAGGAFAWSVRIPRFVGLLATALLFAVVVAFLESIELLLRLGGVGVCTLGFGFLVAQLLARTLESRTTWPRVMIALAALVLALCASFAVMLLARWNVWVPVWVSLAADVGLVIPWWRTRPLPREG